MFGVAVLVLALSILLVSSADSSFSVQRTAGNPAKLLQSFAQSADDNSSAWHVGGNQSTPEVDVNYTQDYTTSSALNVQPENKSVLDTQMVVSYNDGTGEMIQFDTRYFFNQGGLNVTGQQVLNWNDVNQSGVVLNTFSNVNGTSLDTIYSFNGFEILNGTASQFNLTSYVPYGPGAIIGHAINNIIGSINYANCSSITIGNVALSTANTTTPSGATINQSIAKFNVTMEAQITDIPLPPQQENALESQNSSTIPVILMFEITHDTLQTEIKYGVDIDWSALKAFPTATELAVGPINQNPLTYNILKTGDNYSLVAQDNLAFSYGSSHSASTYLGVFSSDPQNDSAIFIANGTQVCRELFPTNYTLEGSSQVYNTTRLYVSLNWEWNGSSSTNNNESAIYVVFGGFKYNESSGFAFDPAVITPNSVISRGPSSTTPTTSETSSASASSGSSPSVASTASSSNRSNSTPNAELPTIYYGVIAVAIVGILGGTFAFLIRRGKRS